MCTRYDMWLAPRTPSASWHEIQLIPLQITRVTHSWIWILHGWNGTKRMASCASLTLAFNVTRVNRRGIISIVRHQKRTTDSSISVPRLRKLTIIKYNADWVKGDHLPTLIAYFDDAFTKNQQVETRGDQWNGRFSFYQIIARSLSISLVSFIIKRSPLSVSPCIGLAILLIVYEGFVSQICALMPIWLAIFLIELFGSVYADQFRQQKSEWDCVLRFFFGTNKTCGKLVGEATKFFYYNLIKIELWQKEICSNLYKLFSSNFTVIRNTSKIVQCLLLK